MPRTKEAQDRHNELRRKMREKSRQAMFSMDYIGMMYPEIYRETEQFFTLLNTRYPNKIDLRKTNEYTCFKKQISEGKESTSGEELYFNIKTGMVTVRQPENPQAIEPSRCETIEPSRCETIEPSRCETIETSRCETIEPSPFKTIEPSLEPQVKSKELEPQIEITLISENQVKKATHTSETLDITMEQEMPPEPQMEITVSSENQDEKATLTTQTLDITTEQEMPPVSIDEIPHDTIDEIIAQLRQDPDLTNIFNDIDFQMEFDALGEDLDIPETPEQEPWW